MSSEPPTPVRQKPFEPADALAAAQGGQAGAGPKRPHVTLAKPASQRLLHGVAGLVVLVALTYAIPGLDGLRPWQPDEDYVPFWNLVGRPGAEPAAHDAQLRRFEAMAREQGPHELSDRRERPPASRPRPGDSSLEGRQTDTPEPSAAEPALAAQGAAEAGDAGAAASGTEESPAHRSQVPRIYLPYAPDTPAEPPSQPLEHPERLAHFFSQLTLADLGVPGAVARAGHWGDSVLGGDGLTDGIRRRLQARFGDAGHGFHNLTKYGVGYYHRGIRFSQSGKWRSCEIIFKCRPDGHYGYGGASSGSYGGGISRFSTAEKGFGSRASSFELWYAKHPKGSSFQILVDGELVADVDTKAPELQDAVEVVHVDDGPHQFEVRAKGPGYARGYGVVLEREGPGVVWDELSLIGSFTKRLDYQDPDHLAWQLKRRGVDLMAFMFGGNDVQRQASDLKKSTARYELEYRSVVSKFQAGRPRASCLIMSLIDHGERKGAAVVTREIVPRLVEAQRRVANAQGCAFFDTFTAMGGKGSIGRWYNARPQLAAGDLSHPTRRGQGVIAAMLYTALMYEYAEFRQVHAGQLLPPLGGFGVE